MNDILRYKNYFAAVHFSSVDEVFYGKIVGINDLISFEGASVKELKTSFEEAIEDYLNLCEEIGKQPEKTYKGTFNVRVSSSLHKEASIFAAVNNITLNQLVKNSLSFALKHKKQLIEASGDNLETIGFI